MSFYVRKGRDGQPNGWRWIRHHKGRQLHIGFHGISRNQMEDVDRHLNVLVNARKTGASIPYETKLWLSSLCDKVHEKIVALKLAPPRAVGESKTMRLADLVSAIVPKENIAPDLGRTQIVVPPLILNNLKLWKFENLSEKQRNRRSLKRNYAIRDRKKRMSRKFSEDVFMSLFSTGASDTK